MKAQNNFLMQQNNTKVRLVRLLLQVFKHLMFITSANGNLLFPDFHQFVGE